MAPKRSVLLALADTHHGFFKGAARYAREHRWHVVADMIYTAKIPVGWRGDELLVAHNEAAREPAFNLQKARVYMAAADPEVATRTWRKALVTLVSAKRAGTANRHRWETFLKDKALQPLLDIVILETRAEQFMSVLTNGKVSTNVYLRRLQNFCVGMNWLP